MGNFIRSIGVHKHLSEADQIKAGKASGTDMDQKHKTFLADIIGMLDRKEIDITKPESFLNPGLYETLSEQAKGIVDFALLNIVDQVRRIEWYYRSTSTPNASPELQTMIEHLWDMTRRLEDKHGDILKF